MTKEGYNCLNSMKTKTKAEIKPKPMLAVYQNIERQCVFIQYKINQ